MSKLTITINRPEYLVVDVDDQEFQDWVSDSIRDGQTEEEAISGYVKTYLDEAEWSDFERDNENITYEFDDPINMSGQYWGE